MGHPVILVFKTDSLLPLLCLGQIFLRHRASVLFEKATDFRSHPGEGVDSIGDVTNRDFGFWNSGPYALPHPTRNLAVDRANPIRLTRQA